MRVSLINSVCRARDAIGEAVHETWRAIVARPDWECRLFTMQSEFPEIGSKRARRIADLVTDSWFVSSDVHLYHFGIYWEPMNCLAAGSERTKRVVRFHNVTPKEFAPPSAHALIEKSIEQIAVLDFADQLWADSPYNARDLVRAGISADKIVVDPLFAKPRFAFESLAAKPGGRAELLFVGRFVPSKGVLDLLSAVERLRASGAGPFHLSLVGALRSSDAAYVRQVKRAIAARGLRDLVTFVGELDEGELAQAYSRAHVVVLPSYHEGFCVPLIEAMHAKAIPVAYEAGNMPDLIAGMGPIVPVGDIEALAQALRALIDWLPEFWAGSGAGPPIGEGRRSGIGEYEERVRAHVAQFTLDEFHARIVRRLSALTGSS